MKILLAGGTGFIGSALTQRLLNDGHQLILLSRKPDSISFQSDRLKVEHWDGKNAGPWTKHIEGCDAIINLTGASIASGRWTQKKKSEILNSRVQSTAVIANAIAQAHQRPKVFINASAVGYYGSVESGEVNEISSGGSGFLADVCRDWEEQANPANKYGVRVVLLRSGIVLEKNGGVLAKMLLPFKMFVGGPFGSGRQWFPWIHIDDEIGAILFILENEKISGPINMVSPQPVTMGEFCKVLGKVLNRPSFFNIPEFILRLALGEMSEMLLTGQKAVPEKLLQNGYPFKYPSLLSALQAISSKL